MPNRARRLECNSWYGGSVQAGDYWTLWRIRQSVNTRRYRVGVMPNPLEHELRDALALSLDLIEPGLTGLLLDCGRTA
jgi:hypothetical protein